MEKYIRFSERIGKKEVIRKIQTDTINRTSKNRIWNILEETIFSLDDLWDDELSYYKQELYKHIWDKFLKKPVFKIPEKEGDAIVELRKEFFRLHNYNIYDFVEFIIVFLEDVSNTHEINRVFEEELLPYRFVNLRLTPITNEVEIDEIDNVIINSHKYGLKGVSEHIDKAVQHFSNREKPDFRNSIKESISAVEAICRIITGDTKVTLGQALKVLKKDDVTYHKSLLDAFDKLYGYTSDDGGFRHSLITSDKVQIEDARFFLVSCSAFINYLTIKAEKQDLIKTKD